MLATLTAAVMAAAVVTGHGHEATPKPCTDATVSAIRYAGWKGADRRIAYGIAWRESNFNPGAVGAGSYGLFQIQASAWQDRSWFSWSSLLTAKGNAKIAHKIWRITGWSAWGINRAGDGIDSTWYGGWDSSTQYAWIWKPYTVGLAKYDALPKACRS